MLHRILVSGIVACVLCGPGLQLRAAPPQGLWIDVPYIQQTQEGCGSASLAMVMQYWLARQGKAIPAAARAETIQKQIYSPRAHGIYASAMKQYLEQNGFTAYTVEGDSALLAHHLQNGRPLIVALEPERGTPFHYVVVVGIDPAQQVVLVNDPQQRKLLKEDAAVFNRQWKEAGNWTLLAVPADRAH